MAAKNSAKNGAEVLLAQFEPQRGQARIVRDDVRRRTQTPADPLLTEVISVRTAGTETGVDPSAKTRGAI
ncbi:hypothetical protein [Mycobacterium colombiense]|uniref:hypothetical protein n=1 Tax=Mycobacterium colombiense TaxID=339268 RepID=UPI0012DB1DCF|nr:hypothetical protein [Mycobacterium colombiense]